MGDSVMNIDMTVLGTTTMDKVGVDKVYIEERVNGVWRELDTLYGSDNSDFYMYNKVMYSGEVNFTGIPGRSYRVTLSVYAENDGGYDTGTILSQTVVCK